MPPQHSGAGGAGTWPTPLPPSPGLGAGIYPSNALWGRDPPPPPPFSPCGVGSDLPRPPNKASGGGLSTLRAGLGPPPRPQPRRGGPGGPRLYGSGGAGQSVARDVTTRRRRAVAAVTAAMEGGGRPSAAQAALLAASTALTALLYSVYRQKARVARGLEVGARGSPAAGMGTRRGPGPHRGLVPSAEPRPPVSSPQGARRVRLDGDLRAVLLEAPGRCVPYAVIEGRGRAQSGGDGGASSPQPSPRRGMSRPQPRGSAPGSSSATCQVATEYPDSIKHELPALQPPPY